MLEKGKKVTFHYTIKVGGKVRETTIGRKPLQYEYGKDSLLPALQKPLLHAKQGDQLTVMVKPEDGFGFTDPAKFVEVDKSKMPAPDIQPGTQIKLTPNRHDEGVPRMATVRSVQPKTVTLDLNHPLAGKNLEFLLEILQVA